MGSRSFMLLLSHDNLISLITVSNQDKTIHTGLTMKNEERYYDDEYYDEGMSWLEIFQVLVKHWKMLVKVLFAVILITALVSLLISNKYTATTLILPGAAHTNHDTLVQNASVWSPLPIVSDSSNTPMRGIR